MLAKPSFRELFPAETIANDLNFMRLLLAFDTLLLTNVTRRLPMQVDSRARFAQSFFFLYFIFMLSF